MGILRSTVGDSRRLSLQDRPSIREGLDRFVLFQRARGLSPRTVKTYYAWGLKASLVRFCEDQGLRLLEEVTPAVLDQLALHLYERPIARATVIGYLRATNHFLTWARSQGYAQDAPKLKIPRPERKRRDVLTPGEVQALEDGARSERDKLIVRVLAETGCREGELVSIQVSDLVIREGRFCFVRLRGKTGERMPPISGGLHRRLRAYAEGRSGRPRSGSGALFLAARRRSDGSHVALTESGVRQVIYDAADRAGLSKRVYPHLLRHSAITRMVAGGMHPVLVSEICGVSVGVIAQHYAHPSDEQRWLAAEKLWT